MEDEDTEAQAPEGPVRSGGWPNLFLFPSRCLAPPGTAAWARRPPLGWVAFLAFLGLILGIGLAFPEAMGVGAGWPVHAPVLCAVLLLLGWFLEVSVKAALMWGLLRPFGASYGLRPCLEFTAVFQSVPLLVSQGIWLVAARALDPGTAVEILTLPLPLYIFAWFVSGFRAFSGFSTGKTVGFLVLWLGGSAFVAPLLVPRGLLGTRMPVSTTMAPTIDAEDVVLENRLAPYIRPWVRQDVVVYRHPGSNPPKDFIARILGFPGEEVRWEGTRVWVDGVLIEEPYVTPEVQRLYEEQYGRLISGPQVRGARRLGADEYFLMKDNRAAGRDSRYFGPVSGGALLGLVVGHSGVPRTPGPMASWMAGR